MKNDHRWVHASILASVGGLMLAAGIVGGHALAARSAPTARARFKNILVLKTLPADQLIPTMHMYCASLGVDCGFCHAGRDFAADTKPEKKMARTMILMVQDMDRREKVLEGHATCFMCHHGHSSPERQPPPSAPRAAVTP